MCADTESVYYDNEEIWQPSRYGTTEMDRARLVSSWLPAPSGSVLDVGCGNGTVTNLIDADGLVVGVDRSSVALRWVNRPRARADVSHLPFHDASFDTVLATEVLEHLPQKTYAAALRELARVTRSTLLVTVPYCEDLVAAHCICPRCLCRFHPNYHMRSYGHDSLQALFRGDGLDLRRIAPVFAGTRYLAFARIRAALQTRDSHLPRFARCPQCGHTDPSTPTEEGQPRATTGNMAKALIKRVWPRARTYRWWMALYAKQPTVGATTKVGG